jgi:hypothetical protein
MTCSPTRTVCGETNSALSQQHLATVTAKALRIVVLLNVVDDSLDMIGDLAEIDDRLDGGQAEIGAAAHERGDASGVDQRLARHAAVMQAVAAKRRRLFDQCDLQAELGGDARHHESACAAANDNEIAPIHEASSAPPSGRRLW